MKIKLFFEIYPGFFEFDLMDILVYYEVAELVVASLSYDVVVGDLR